jgi:hypothetical protein
MKTLLKLTFVFILFLSTTEAKTKTYPPIDEIVPAMDLTPEAIQGLIAGMYPNVAIELKEGSSVPLHFLLQHKFFSLKCDPNLSIQITTPCYLRAVGKKFLLSTDLIQWNSPNDFFRGSFIPNIQVSKDKSHVLVETNFVESPEDDECDDLNSY